MKGGEEGERDAGKSEGREGGETREGRQEERDIGKSEGRGRVEM